MELFFFLQPYLCSNEINCSRNELLVMSSGQTDNKRDAPMRNYRDVQLRVNLISNRVVGDNKTIIFALSVCAPITARNNLTNQDIQVVGGYGQSWTLFHAGLLFLDGGGSTLNWNLIINENISSVKLMRTDDHYTIQIAMNAVIYDYDTSIPMCCDMQG